MKGKTKEWIKEHTDDILIALGATSMALGMISFGLNVFNRSKVIQMNKTVGTIEDTSVDIIDITDENDKKIGHAVVESGAFNKESSYTLGFNLGSNVLLYECIGD